MQILVLRRLDENLEARLAGSNGFLEAVQICIDEGKPHEVAFLVVDEVQLPLQMQ